MHRESVSVYYNLISLNLSNAKTTSFNNLFGCDNTNYLKCKGCEINFFRYTLIINTISNLESDHKIAVFGRKPFFTRVIVLNFHPSLCYAFIRIVDIVSYTITVYRIRATLVKVCSKVFFSFLNSFLFSVVSIRNLSNGLYSKLY